MELKTFFHSDSQGSTGIDRVAISEKKLFANDHCWQNRN
jgi:hypothetical protein